jgi:hypothetical protein
VTCIMDKNMPCRKNSHVLYRMIQFFFSSERFLSNIIDFKIYISKLIDYSLNVTNFHNLIFNVLFLTTVVKNRNRFIENFCLLLVFPVIFLLKQKIMVYIILSTLPMTRVQPQRMHRYSCYQVQQNLRIQI